MPELLGTPLFNHANLQEYYTLEDANADKNGNNLTNNGSVTFSAAQFNNGANFGSANSTKSLELTSALSYTGGAYSIVGWLKLLAEIGSGVWGIFFLQESTSDTQFHINYQYNSGTPQLAFIRNKFGGASQSFTYNITLGTTDFYHLAICYDGSNFIGYVNGVNVGNANASGSGSVGIVNRFKIGAIDDGSGGESAFASILADDVALFNTQLTQEEVLQHYRGTLGGYISIN